MSINTSVSLPTLGETEIIEFTLRYAAEHSQPLAFWRRPQQQQRHLLLSEEQRFVSTHQTIEELEPGFLLAPFDRSKERVFLPADFLFTFENQTLKPGETEKEIKSAAWLSNAFRPSEKEKRPKPRSVEKPALPDDDHYIKSVKKAVEEIERGTLEKVVLSRKKIIHLPEDFDVVSMFEKLCAAYPDALISYVSIPGIGQWLGATPETLVGVEEDCTFRTIALAGTLPFKEGMDLKSIAWTQKEIEEQALVERYIISCFKKIRLREYEEHGPKTVVAGNLVHLRSDFTVDLKATNFPQLGSVMLELLHPTSAVCGSPIDTALEFIHNEEKHDREFYSGYLGPVNINRSIDLFVNLRCMKLQGNEAALYAGAGITEGSIGEKELAETEMKFKTLLNIITG